MPTSTQQHKGISALLALACAAALALFLGVAPAWALDEEMMADEEATAAATMPAEAQGGADEEGMAADDEEQITTPAPVADPAPAQPAQEEATRATPPSVEVVQMGETTAAPAPTIAAEAQEDDAAVPTIRYIGYVQGRGWLPEYSSDGTTMGTIGKGLRLESFKIRLDTTDTGLSGDVLYRARVQTGVWHAWRKNGQLGGSSVRGRRVEAIQVKLRGAIADAYDVYYTTYVQNRGWMDWATNGETSGTAGLDLRVEALRVVLVRKGASLSSDLSTCGKRFDGGKQVGVSAYVRGKGWRTNESNGGVVGTTGEYLPIEMIKVSGSGLDVPGRVVMKGYVQGSGWTSWAEGTKGVGTRGKRLEAVIIDLRGEAAKKYDIYYRAHVGKLGWLKWTKNGKKAGTAQLSNRMEAIQVMLVKKGAAAPANTGSAKAAYVYAPSVYYRVHAKGKGWQSRVSDGQKATAMDDGSYIEAFRATVSGGNLPGNLTYTAFVSGRGWHKMRAMGKGAGTIGEGRGIEGVKIQLSGQAAKFYDVYYRVYMPKVGWLGWAKNGAEAGAPGAKYAMRAMQIKLVRKGYDAPGSTKYSCVSKGFFDTGVTNRAQRYSSSTGWLILVDTTTCQLNVFRGSQGNWERYDSWVVSCGAPATPSVTGVYQVGDKGYVFGHGYSCYYYTQWNGAYLFHSIKYYEGTFDVMDGTLGGHVSAGCVRMAIDRAKWIYDNIPVGTTVVTY